MRKYAWGERLRKEGPVVAEEGRAWQPVGWQHCTIAREKPKGGAERQARAVGQGHKRASNGRGEDVTRSWGEARRGSWEASVSLA